MVGLVSERNANQDLPTMNLAFNAFLIFCLGVWFILYGLGII